MNSAISHMNVIPVDNVKNLTVPPDTLRLHLEDKEGDTIKNNTFAYSFRGAIYREDNEIDKKVFVKIFKICKIK